MKRRALITGITGQDGSYLAEFLLEKDYEVYGLVRRSSDGSLARLQAIEDRLYLIAGDITDFASLIRAIQLARPQEVYHLAAQSHVGNSYLEPFHTSEVTGMGALRLFEAVRTHTTPSDHVRLYQASSSEQWGLSSAPQDETTPFEPQSPYASAKAWAHANAHLYRRAYQMFISCGIATNHESPRRSETFVTRKITQAVARIKAGQQSVLRLGQLDTRRDWLHAKDVVRGAWLTLQHPLPEDFVFASGQSHSVQEFLEAAFHVVGLSPEAFVVSDPQCLRPLEVPCIQGNAGKARQLLQWQPTVAFPDLVKEMVNADLAAVGLGDSVPSEGLLPSPAIAEVHSVADVPKTSV